MSQMHPDRRPARAGRLDRLLGRWASAHRLDEQRAEAIRQAIVSTPTARGFDWWWRLLDPEDGTAFRATRRNAPDVSTPGPRSRPSRMNAWPTEPDDDFQPYLRLT